MKDIDKIFINPKASLKEAIEKLNQTAVQILLVVDNQQKLLGTLTDGDIRRCLVQDISLKEPTETAMNRSPTVVHEANRDDAIEIIRNQSFKAVPLVNDSNEIKDVLFSRDFSDKFTYDKKPNMVFILAGGKGTRMKPFTNVFPKPLIPLGELPIVEVIMKRFEQFGFSNFTLSLNYKADLIKMYFNSAERDYNLKFVEESSFCGTAGSLYLVKNEVKDTVLVANCDVIVDVDFDSFYAFHRKGQFSACILGVVQHFKIPYGVMKMDNAELESFEEKPEYDYLVNAGIYCIEPELLQFVNDHEYLDMPSLLTKAKEAGFRIGIYPVSSEMVDVGHWNQYEKALESAKKFGFISK